MANLSKNVIGNFSGKVGKIVGYERYGKQQFRSLQDKYPTKSKKLKAHRKKFSSVNYFSKAVYHTELINEVWIAKEKEKMFAYNKILSLNSKHFKDNHPTAANVITPDGEENPVSNITFNADKLNVKLLCETSGTLAVVIVPFDPQKTTLPNFEVISLTAACPQALEFETAFKPGDLTKIKKYPEYLIFSAVVDKTSGTLVWTKTKCFT